MLFRKVAWLALLGAALPGAEPVMIRNARVFDGVRMHAPGDVLIVDGRIGAMGRNLKREIGVQVIDATGKTLLPGLIEAHMHLVSRESLRSALSFGVTTCLDMFTSREIAGAIRAEQSSGTSVDLADLRSAGTLVTTPSGHGTEYGFVIPTLARPGDAQAFIDARIAEGSDYIKLVKDDGSSFGFHRPTLDDATLSAAVRAAHRRHKLAIVHIATKSDARAAIAAGADGLAHVYAGDSDDMLVSEAARHHVFWTPTLSVTARGCQQSSKQGLEDDPHVLARLSEQARRNLIAPADMVPDPGRCQAGFEAVRRMKAAGVVILAGTDAPNPGTADGASLHGELALLVEAGLSPVEALTAATSAPALAYGLSDRGRIAPGLRADVILVDGDPAADIRASRRVIAIWKCGVQFTELKKTN
jgi:imidazolonepropionase-like amidohydrolase